MKDVYYFILVVATIRTMVYIVSVKVLLGVGIVACLPKNLI